MLAFLTPEEIPHLLIATAKEDGTLAIRGLARRITSRQMGHVSVHRSRWIDTVTS